MKTFFLFLLLAGCLAPAADAASVFPPPRKSGLTAHDIRVQTDSLMRHLQRSCQPVDAEKLMEKFAQTSSFSPHERERLLEELFVSAGLNAKGPRKAEPLFIYLGEMHGLAWVQHLIIAFLKKYSTTFPERKILLATEFLPDTEFLQAGQKPAVPSDSGIYGLVVREAVKLNMDVLGLEDTRVCFRETEGSYSRVCTIIGGEKVILKTQRAAAAKRPLRETDYAQSVVNYAAGPWGMDARNRHWLQRILPLRKNYDVVIVYAGQAHLDANIPFSVPRLIQSENAVSVTWAYNISYGKLGNWLLRQDLTTGDAAYHAAAIETYIPRENRERFVIVKPKPGTPQDIRRQFGYDAWVFLPRKYSAALKQVPDF